MPDHRIISVADPRISLHLIHLLEKVTGINSSFPVEFSSKYHRHEDREEIIHISSHIFLGYLRSFLTGKKEFLL